MGIDGRRADPAQGVGPDAGAVGRAQEPDRQLHSEQSPDIARLAVVHGDRLTNAAKLLSINLATGAVTNGGKTLTIAAMLDVAGILFKGAPAYHLTVESIPSSGTLQISINENDEFVSVVVGDRFENEEIRRLYLKVSGSGIATVRLNARVRKDGSYNADAAS